MPKPRPLSNSFLMQEFADIGTTDRKGQVSLFILMGTLFGCCSLGQTISSSLHVEGAITEGIERRGKYEEAQYAFWADINDCNWSFRIVPSSPDYSSAKRETEGHKSFILTADQLVASSDSTNFYYYETFKKHWEALVARGEIGNDAVGADGVARRGPGAVPYGIDNKLILLWYTFASRCYFASNSESGLIPPMQRMVDAFYLTNHLLVSGFFESLPDSSGFPKYVISSNAYNYPTDWMLSYLKTNPPNTNVVFKIQSITNVGDVVIPTVTSASYYSFEPQEGAVVNRPFDHTRLVVHHVRRGSDVTQYIPPFPGRCYFEDLQPLSEGQFASMMAEDWPGEPHVKAAAFKYEIDTQNAGLPNTHASAPRSVLVMVYAVISLGVAGAFCLLAVKTNNKRAFK